MQDGPRLRKGRNLITMISECMVCTWCSTPRERRANSMNAVAQTLGKLHSWNLRKSFGLIQYLVRFMRCFRETLWAGPVRPEACIPLRHRNEWCCLAGHASLMADFVYCTRNWRSAPPIFSWSTRFLSPYNFSSTKVRAMLRRTAYLGIMHHVSELSCICGSRQYQPGQSTRG